jgi:hypothetical protein
MYLSALRKDWILIPVLVVHAEYQLQQKAPAREALEVMEVTEIVGGIVVWC